MLMSRKGRLTGEEFTVNLIEGWKELMWRIESSSSCLVFVQRRKMSSRNRPQNSLGMRTGLAAIMASSNQAMKRLAREGAMGVPIAVPNTCWNSSPSNSNTNIYIHERERERERERGGEREGGREEWS